MLRTGLPERTYHVATQQLFLDHTPLYAYLIAPLSIFGTGPEIWMSRALSASLGLATVIAAFAIVYEVRGTAAGVIAGLLLASNPYFLTFSWFVRMEVPMCLALVLALYCLLHERWFAAGLLIAVAVMLKEIAFAFWAIAVVYALIRRGFRKAAIVAIPAPAAFFAWLAFAAWHDPDPFHRIIGRWTNSVGGNSAWDKRFYIPLRTWVRTIASNIVGILLGGVFLVTAVVAVARRRRLPLIAWVPILYVAAAVASTFVIKLKEDRWLIAVVPMMAIAVGLMLDWTGIWRWIVHLTIHRSRRRDGRRVRCDPAQPIVGSRPARRAVAGRHRPGASSA